MYIEHPKCIVATRALSWKRVKSGSDSFTGKSPRVMQKRLQRYDEKNKERQHRARQERLDILNSTLRHGAKWEQEIPSFISAMQHYQLLHDDYNKHKFLRRLHYDMNFDPVCAVRTPSAKSKHQKRRGAREVRHIEMQAGEDDRLTPESATQLRAHSAIIHYLWQDRPDAAFAAK